MKRNHLYRFLLVVLLGFSGPLFAEGDNAKIVLTFEKRDSINTCKALVTSNDTPVKEIEVKLYVQRMLLMRKAFLVLNFRTIFRQIWMESLLCSPRSKTMKTWETWKQRDKLIGELHG